MIQTPSKEATISATEIEFRHVPRFQSGSPESLAYLDEHGFVIIQNALSEMETAHAISLIWDYLEGLSTGIDRLNVDTWGNDRWPISVHGGILPSQGIGHSPAQWFIRKSLRVQQAFAAIWETTELLTSFDGMSLWRPWQYNSDWKTNEGGSWLHIDQHPIGRPGRHCVQGLVNLLPTSADIGGNVVIPGSHHLFDQIPELYTDRLAQIDSAIDHFRFPKHDPRLKAMQPISCHMKAGDLMLWDSRTIHCSHPGLGQDMDPTQLQRAASLICMMPKSKSNPKVIERRKRAVVEGTSTTNWSDRFINADHFPDVAGHPAASKYTWPTPPELDAQQLKLVGYSDPEIKAL